MGLVGDFFATTVLTYKVESKEAIKDIQNMSKEQKKAAKEASVALKEQGEAASTMGEKYAKGAALVAGAYVLIRSGVQALKNETRLAAGSMGVDLGKLDEAAGGLKTRWDLMTIAQAGSQGAWRLSTQQIGFVIEGMRALEKKGYDSVEVQNQLTESLKKGKLEGLDKFGLSAKSTGSATGDLASLMKQLSGAVVDVGGNFDKSTDALERGTVRMEDALTRLRTIVGQTAAGFVEMGVAIGEAFAWAYNGGEGIPDDASARDPNRYARNFQMQRGGMIGSAPRGTQSPLFTDSSSKLGGTLFPGATDADRAASARLDSFRSKLRNFRGSRQQLGAESDILPAGWRSIDPDLAAKFDSLMTMLPNDNGLTGSYSIPGRNGVPAARPRAAGGAGRGGAAGGYRDPIDWSGFGVAGAGMYGYDPAADRIARAEAWGQSNQDASRAALMAGTGYDHRSSAADREGDAGLFDSISKIEQDIRDAAPGGKTWLAKVFGEVEEFDAYEQGFKTLGDSVRAAGDSVLNSIIANEKITGASIRRSVGAILGAKSHELWAHGLTTALSSIYPFNPVGLASGAAQIAGAMLLGKVAGQFGGKGAAGSGGSAGRSASQDRRGSRPSEFTPAGSHTVVVFPNAFDDMSPRQRAAATNNALRRRESYYPAPRGGA